MKLPICILCQCELSLNALATIMPLPLVMDRQPVPVFACAGCTNQHGDDLSFRMRAAAAASIAGLFDATVPVTTTPRDWFLKPENARLPAKPYVRISR